MRMSYLKYIFKTLKLWYLIFRVTKRNKHPEINTGETIGKEIW